MNNLTLNKLIEHLQRIQTKYGNMPVEANVICGNCGDVVITKITSTM